MTLRRALLVAPLYYGDLFPTLAGRSTLIPRLRKILTTYGKYELTVLDSVTDQPSLRSAIALLMGSDGEVLFYFYGHGALRYQQGVFVTSDAKNNDEGVLMRELFELVVKSPAREIVIILDCCYAGTSTEALESSIEQMGRKLGQSTGRCLLASCSSREQSEEILAPSGERLGAFSYNILEGLNGAASYNTNRVHAAFLGSYVLQKLAEVNWKQNPILNLYVSGSRLCEITSDFLPPSRSAIVQPISSARQVFDGVIPDVPGEMVLVPAGPFIRGKPPGQLTEMDAFYIDKYPVTNAAYRVFLEMTKHKPPPHWNGTEFVPGLENHPVVNVSWYDACAFAEFVGKMLPSTEQWEKAARGTEGRRFPWGSHFDPACANTSENGRAGTTAVDTFPKGMSPYEVFDMAGNVWEWTRTCGSSGRVPIRGGAWTSSSELAACYESRQKYPGYSNGDLGFRCVQEYHSE